MLEMPPVLFLKNEDIACPEGGDSHPNAVKRCSREQNRSTI